MEYLRRTEAFFLRYGGFAVVLSRFMPIFRTLVPFVAGIGRMPYARFFGYNLVGGTAWVALFIWGGYLFGNIPLVKNNFGVVTLLIVAVSLLPLAVALPEEAPHARPEAPGACRRACSVAHQRDDDADDAAGEQDECRHRREPVAPAARGRDPSRSSGNTGCGR